MLACRLARRAWRVLIRERSRREDLWGVAIVVVVDGSERESTMPTDG